MKKYSIRFLMEWERCFLLQAQQFSANVCKNIQNSVDADFAAQKERELQEVIND